MEPRDKKIWDAEKSRQEAIRASLKNLRGKEFTGYLRDTQGVGLENCAPVEFEAFKPPSVETQLRAYIPYEGIHEVMDLMALGETNHGGRDWRATDYKEHLNHMWDHAAQLVGARDPLALDPDSGKPVLIHVATRALMTWCAAKKQR
jgi:hypothetical protein